MLVTICIGSSCHLKGSRDVIAILERLVSIHGISDQVELTGSFCMGECAKGVCVKVDDEQTQKSFSMNIFLGGFSCGCDRV